MSLDPVADSQALPGVVQLDRAAIQQLMHELDNRLHARGVSARLYIIGGAALAIAHDRKNVTPDVDAAVSHAAVFEEAEKIAEVYGLSPRWLNDSGAGYAPPPPPDMVAKHSSRPGLTILIAPAEHLLAMKLRADRTKDVPDIAALIAECGLLDGTPQDLVDLMQEVYSGEDELAHILAIPKSAPDGTATEALRRCEYALAVARKRFGRSQP